MKCQKCNENQANTHIQKIVNGKKAEYYLCDKCAKELGFNQFSFSFGNDFDNLFGSFFGNAVKNIAPASGRVCGNCHMTLSEFLKNGRLGCSECYKAFRDALNRPLKQIHGATEHTGKIPQKGGVKISKEAKIRRLQTELDAAVLSQEFEKAAQLRDEIKALNERGDE